MLREDCIEVEFDEALVNMDDDRITRKEFAEFQKDTKSDFTESRRA